MDTKIIRRNFNLTQKEFSLIFDIPYSTVRNWDARDCMPFYVWGLIDKIIKHKYESFKYEILLMPDKPDLSKEQIKKEFIEMLKDEAQTALRFENELNCR